MAFGVGVSGDEAMFGDPSSWDGPQNGVDVSAEAGMNVGPVKWHAQISTDTWTLIIMLASLAALWVLGGVVFRKINLF